MSRFEDYAQDIIDSISGINKELDEFPERNRPKTDHVPTQEAIIRNEAASNTKVSRWRRRGTPGEVKDKQVPPELIDDIEEGILNTGLEALAFYKSIHYRNRDPFRRKWGIFIFEYAVPYLTYDLLDYYDKKVPPMAGEGYGYRHKSLDPVDYFTGIAEDMLVSHERYHFRFDAWALAQEAIMCQPLYSRYDSEYQRVFGSNECHEESLANSASFYKIRNSGASDYFCKFMDAQPGAYNDFRNRNPFRRRIDIAKQFFKETFSDALSYAHAPYIGKSHSLKDCPIWLVCGIQPSIFVRPTLFLPDIKEMEKGFIGDYLKGIKLKRTDHAKYKIDNNQTVKIPNSHKGCKKVKLREFTNLTRKAGLLFNHFYNARKKTKVWTVCTPRRKPLSPII